MENVLNDSMKFYPGFDIRATTERLGFAYGKDVFGPGTISEFMERI